MFFPAAMMPLFVFAAVVVNTSWLPGVVEGIVATAFLVLLVKSKKWVTDWFVSLLAHIQNVDHNTKANGLNSDTAGDTSKRTENTVAVLFRIMFSQVDLNTLDPELAAAVLDLARQYGAKS